MFLPFCSLEEEGGPEEVLPAVRYVSSARLKGKIYSIGSFNGHLQSKPDDSLNPNPLQWTMVKQTNNFRIEACAVLFENKIVVLGGLNDFHLEGYQSIEIYDPETDIWTLGLDMCLPRHRHKAVVLKHHIYAIGGNQIGGYQSKIEQLDLRNPNARWTLTPHPQLIENQLEYMSHFGATVVNSKVMLVSPGAGCVPHFYSEETNQWTLASQPMGLKRGGELNTEFGQKVNLVTVKGLPNRKDYR